MCARHNAFAPLVALTVHVAVLRAKEVVMSSIVPVIPEPTVLALIALGVVALVARQVKRLRHHTPTRSPGER